VTFLFTLQEAERGGDIVFPLVEVTSSSSSLQSCSIKHNGDEFEEEECLSKLKKGPLVQKKVRNFVY
jgi:hypothetical protein